MTKSITRQELEQAIDAGQVTVVETLREEHFAQGHLPGAIHIHFEAIAEKAPELLPDKDAPIVTYCSNTACRNSEIAAHQLTRLGYSNVRKYPEGKQDWQDAGLPLEVASTVAVDAVGAHAADRDVAPAAADQGLEADDPVRPRRRLA
jgi:rhodanese-related sulfurtransferase